MRWIVRFAVAAWFAAGAAYGAAPAGKPEGARQVPLMAWVSFDAQGVPARIEWREPASEALQRGAEPLLRALRSEPPGAAASLRTHVVAMLLLEPRGEDFELRLEQPALGPRLVERRAPRYPSPALPARREAHLVARFTVTAEGLPRDVQIEARRTDEAFAAAVREALKSWRFEPEQRDGAPVATPMCVPFRFTFAGQQREPEVQDCPDLPGRARVAGQPVGLAEVEVTVSKGPWRRELPPSGS